MKAASVVTIQQTDPDIKRKFQITIWVILLSLLLTWLGAGVHRVLGALFALIFICGLIYYLILKIQAYQRNG